MLWALSLVMAASPNAANSDARLLTELVADAAAKVPGVDVLTSEDVRKAVSLEADKQVLGCTDQSCLAEIAQAMGAPVVVYGSVGHIAADELVLTLAVFDSIHAQSAGREVIRGATLKAVGDQIPSVTTKLIADKVAPGDKKVRILVLDLEARAGTADTAHGIGWLTFTGGGLAVVGVLAAATGVFFDVSAASADTAADAPTLSQKKASALYDTRDNAAVGAAVGYGGGAVLIVAGLALAAADLLTGGAE